MSNRFRSLLDIVADRLGYAPKGVSLDDTILRGAYWFVSVGGGPEISLGKNLLTLKMRANAAGLLARTFAETGVLYDADQGWVATDPVCPTQLAVGQGTTAAQRGDWTMYDPLLVPGGATVKYFPLTRILFHKNPASYSPPSLPISVSYFFDIPAGEMFEGVGTDVDFQEWALFGPAAPALLAPPTDPEIDQDMLARKVTRLSKISDLDLTVRWELRT